MTEFKLPELKRKPIVTHDFDHLLRQTETEKSVWKWHLHDNYHVFLPSATKEQIKQLHNAFAKAFQSRPPEQDEASARKTYYSPACHFDVYDKIPKETAAELLVKQIDLPMRSSFITGGGSGRHGMQAEAQQFVEMIRLLKDLGIEAKISRVRKDKRDEIHVWHINPPEVKSKASIRR